MKKRPEEYYRKERIKAIRRKKKIIKDHLQDGIPKEFDSQNLVGALHADVPGFDNFSIWNYNHDGMLSKGKIHCSCPLCTFQGTTYSDAKRLERARYNLTDYMDEEGYNSNIRKEIDKIEKKNKKESYPMYARRNEKRTEKKIDGSVGSFYEFKLIELIQRCERLASDFEEAVNVLLIKKYLVSDLLALLTQTKTIVKTDYDEYLKILEKDIEDTITFFVRDNHIPAETLNHWLAKIRANDHYFTDGQGSVSVREMFMSALERLTSGH